MPTNAVTTKATLGRGVVTPKFCIMKTKILVRFQLIHMKLVLQDNIGKRGLSLSHGIPLTGQNKQMGRAHTMLKDSGISTDQPRIIRQSFLYQAKINQAHAAYPKISLE